VPHPSALQRGGAKGWDPRGPWSNHNCVTERAHSKLVNPSLPQPPPFLQLAIADLFPLPEHNEIKWVPDGMRVGLPPLTLSSHSLKPKDVTCRSSCLSGGTGISSLEKQLPEKNGFRWVVPIRALWSIRRQRVLFGARFACRFGAPAAVCIQSGNASDSSHRAPGRIRLKVEI
jgi:hypothetical protein